MRLIGAKVPRVEDRRILTGRGHYIDDLHLPHMLHATYLRSPVAHARITAIDVEAARTAPGVVAVFTGEDMKALSNPIAVPMAMGVKVPVFYPLATDRVRFVGDLVAMVVAQTRYEAEDASELIEVSYDPLPAVATGFAIIWALAWRRGTELDQQIVRNTGAGVQLRLERPIDHRVTRAGDLHDQYHIGRLSDRTIHPRCAHHRQIRDQDPARGDPDIDRLQHLQVPIRCVTATSPAARPRSR